MHEMLCGIFMPAVWTPEPLAGLIGLIGLIFPCTAFRSKDATDLPRKHVMLQLL